MKIKKIPFFLYIKDKKIKEKCEYAFKNNKRVLFLFENPKDEKITKKLNDPKNTPINLSYLKEKQINPKSFSFLNDQLAIIYDSQRNLAFATYPHKHHQQGPNYAFSLLLMNDKIYIISNIRAYEVKEKTLIIIPECDVVSFSVYPPQIDKIIPLLLITQEYENYSLVPCYIDYQVWLSIEI